MACRPGNQLGPPRSDRSLARLARLADDSVSGRQVHRTVSRAVVPVGELLQQSFVSSGHTDESFVAFESLWRVTKREERDDTARYQGERAEADDIEEGGLHGAIMPKIPAPAYSCGYANEGRENQWGYAPTGFRRCEFGSLPVASLNRIANGG